MLLADLSGILIPAISAYNSKIVRLLYVGGSVISAIRYRLVDSH